MLGHLDGDHPTRGQQPPCVLEHRLDVPEAWRSVGPCWAHQGLSWLVVEDRIEREPLFGRDVGRVRDEKVEPSSARGRDRISPAAEIELHIDAKSR